MPDYTVSADVDSMLRSANDAAIRSAIGVGTTDAPTFLKVTAYDATSSGANLNGFQLSSAAFTGKHGLFSKYGSSSEGWTLMSGGTSQISGAVNWPGPWVTQHIGFAPTSTAIPTTFLWEDGAAGILAQRNGSAAQAFRVYNTYTDANNYSRLKIGWDSATYTAFTIEGQQLGTGGGRSLALIGGGNVFGLGVTPSTAFNWVINAGHLLAGADNAHDIGASGANRPRNVYAGTSMSSPTFVSSGSLSAFGSNTQVAGTLHVGYTGSASASLYAPSNGVLLIGNVTANDFGRLQLGGTTSAFPAIKRQSSQIDIVLADNSGYAAIRGKLTTDTAYTGTVVTPTGYITIYDSTGQAYRVPCVV